MEYNWYIYIYTLYIYIYPLYIYILYITFIELLLIVFCLELRSATSSKLQQNLTVSRQVNDDNDVMSAPTKEQKGSQVLRI